MHTGSSVWYICTYIYLIDFHGKFEGGSTPQPCNNHHQNYHIKFLGIPAKLKTCHHCILGGGIGCTKIYQFHDSSYPIASMYGLESICLHLL